MITLHDLSDSFRCRLGPPTRGCGMSEHQQSFGGNLTNTKQQKEDPFFFHVIYQLGRRGMGRM